MKAANGISIGPLKKSELEEADRIFRVAFGTYIGLPNPADFMGDRNLLISRWFAPHVKTLAARENGRLIGSNQITRWGSFAFFGPLTILPEYWDRGIARRLLGATIKIFEKDGPTRTGLFTFPHSTKHVGLYQKYGYWPGYLTALMKLSPENGSAASNGASNAVYLTTLNRANAKMRSLPARGSRMPSRADSI